MASTPSNKMPDSDSMRSDPTAIRLSFRVPVEFQDDISVIINNQSCRVIDISPEGINIVEKNQTPFTAGQLIENCELIIQGNRIKNLIGRIVHYSSDTEGNWNYGIQWIGMANDAQQKIAAIVSKIKQRLRETARE